MRLCCGEERKGGLCTGPLAIYRVTGSTGVLVLCFYVIMCRKRCFRRRILGEARLGAHTLHKSVQELSCGQQVVVVSSRCRSILFRACMATT